MYPDQPYRSAMSVVGQEVIEGSRVESTAGAAARLTSKQLNLQPIQMSVPKYGFSRISPLTGSNSFQIGAGSTQEMLFEIPTKVANLSRSVLSYTKTIADQGAGLYAWDFADTLGELYQVQLYSRGGQMLCDVSNANVMLKVMATKESKLSEVMEEDDAGLLRISNTPAAQNIVPTQGLGTMTGNRNYLEKLYLRVGAVGVGAAATGALSRKIDFKLGQFINTMLAVDKDLVFPEIMVVRLVFQSNKAGFSATSNVNPTTGAAALISGYATTTVQTCVYLTNCFLYHALEKRPDVVKAVIDQMKSGTTLMIPYTWVYKQAISGGQHTVAQKLDSAQGMFLRKAITAIFPNDESKNQAFDHSNLPSTSNTANAGRVTTFYTSLDDERLQEYDYTPTIDISTDWVDQKEMLKGSMISSRHQYYRNWFFCDSWLPESPETGMKGSDVVGGVDIHSRQRKYSLIATSMADTATVFNWYQFFITTRRLTISPTEIKVQ